MKELAKSIGIGLIGFAPEILQLFPKHTLAFKLAMPVGFVAQLFWNRVKYQRDELPHGVDRHFEKMPNILTGKRNVRTKRN